MDLTDLFQFIGERFGLLPVYAIIIAAAGFSARDLRGLLMVLGILGGLYITLFQVFDLKQTLDVFGLSERFGLNADLANMIAAVIYVAGIGGLAHSLRRLFFRRKT
jgi:hypothetical protein